MQSRSAARKASPLPNWGGVLIAEALLLVVCIFSATWPWPFGSAAGVKVQVVRAGRPVQAKAMGALKPPVAVKLIWMPQTVRR